jgi:hypothetical protein
MKTVSAENFDELCLTSLLVGKKSRHGIGELEGQHIVLPGWFMSFTIRFEFVEYGVKKRDWYCSGSRRRAIATETLARRGSL